MIPNRAVFSLTYRLRKQLADRFTEIGLPHEAQEDEALRPGWRAFFEGNSIQMVRRTNEQTEVCFFHIKRNRK